MKRILAGSSFLVLLAANVFAAGKDPEFKVVDGKVSIQAEAITLKQFLQYWDAATGMTSKVNPQLANEKISVRLEGLDVNTAVRKSFQGQPWNWAIVDGKGINVIDRATAVTATSGGSSSPIQSFSDTRNDPPPPQPQLSAPFAQQSGPVPTPANATPANQPAGAVNLPPAQGGPTPPTQLFQPLGTSLGAPLPTVLPGIK
jgi:large exoprotein involved in heme utilization and adhesion